MKKEFGEELLNLKDLESASMVDAMIGIIEDNKELKRLSELLENGKAFFNVTGMILDIYKLRPEITAVLVITDNEFSKKIRNIWESKRIDLIKLNDENAYNHLLTSKDYPLCPPGLAALIKGRAIATKIICGESTKPSPVLYSNFENNRNN
jgi:hypothetical protein